MALKRILNKMSVILKALPVFLLVAACNSTHIEIENTRSGRIERHYSNIDNKSNYIYKEYHNDRIFFVGEVMNNKFYKTKKAFHENGTVMEICELSTPCNLDDCCPDGFYKRYFKNGKIKETFTKKNGLFDGIYNIHDSIGRLNVRINYKEGMKNGLRTHYHKNGKRKEVNNYQQDTLIGFVYRFDLNGDTIEYYNTYKSQMTFPMKFWQKDGKSIYGDFFNNEYKAQWTWYNAKGEIIKQEVYVPIDGHFTIPEY